MIVDQNEKTLEPKNQLTLYGYDKYFYSFKNLYKKNNLPNVILLSGPKGSGKSTFIYHFINYLLSTNDKNKYDPEKFTINSNNNSFKLVKNLIHPNFYLLDKVLSDDSIKIDQIRSLLKFLSKTVYSRGIKIVLIDNSEYLNLNSSNALLKALEEPSNNTYFFIINSDQSKINSTIKSRCVYFKVHFTLSEKKNIFNKLALENQVNFDDINLDKFLYFNAPGEFLKNLIILKDLNLNISKDYLSSILFLMNHYKNVKDINLLNFITLCIENFYNELSLKDSQNINNYFVNKYKILYLINDLKKFNLDKKNLVFSINKILKNET